MHRVNMIDIDMDAKEFKMGEGALLKIRGRKGERLSVRSGEVWVTQYGDPNDYLLKDGDSLELNGKGTALANASKPALLELLGDGRAAGESGRALAGVAALLWQMFA
ncbi:MAG TPA: DUF2917 domain-containing protein [Burkholderiales bacterium]|nr:DUF2917 domain-containing protein [Burkholderiales bacterium]